jgi:hypothetical protein
LNLSNDPNIENIEHIAQALGELRNRVVLVGGAVVGILINDTNRPVADESLINIGLETMRKLGVKADVGKNLRALFQGDSTQVPMVPVLNIGKSRVSRKIALGNRKLVYEKN